MKTPGNTIKVNWLREEVFGTGWQPGTYSLSTFAENSENFGSTNGNFVSVCIIQSFL
jgi:hypothetical protein